MSRILRRPMFRGGRVDSRGTGIASGLGYEKGGRVGYFQDQKGGVVLGKDLIANNIFSGTPRSKDYIEKQEFYKKYVPKTLEDITADYNKLMQQKEDDLLMTYGLDDYSGFQNTVAEDLDYYRDPEGGMKKYFHDAKAKDDAARKEAAKYDVTIEEVINNQTEELPQELTPAQLENIELRKLLEERMKKGTPEEEIEKNRKIFEKAYGSGRADDASAMLLNFAGKALKPEATVKGAFGEFFEEEGKRPSERKKYKDAATTAAINAYLTGEKSLAEMEAFMKKTNWQLNQQAALKKAGNDPSNLDWTDRRTYYMTSIKGSNRDSDKVIKMSLQDEKSEQGKQIFETKETEWITNPAEAAEMDDGLYIVSPNKGSKRIIEIKDGRVLDRSNDFPL